MTLKYTKSIYITIIQSKSLLYRRKKSNQKKERKKSNQKKEYSIIYTKERNI